MRNKTMKKKNRRLSRRRLSRRILNRKRFSKKRTTRKRRIKKRKYKRKKLSGGSSDSDEVTGKLSDKLIINFKPEQGQTGGVWDFVTSLNGRYIQVTEGIDAWKKEGTINLKDDANSDGSPSQDYDVHLRKFPNDDLPFAVGRGWTIGLVLPQVEHDTRNAENMVSMNEFRRNTMLPIFIDGTAESDDRKGIIDIVLGDNVFKGIMFMKLYHLNKYYRLLERTCMGIPVNDETLWEHVYSEYINAFIDRVASDSRPVRFHIKNA